MTETFTKEQVELMIVKERLRERIVSSVLTAIQRARNVGDEPIYINALAMMLSPHVVEAAVSGITIQQPAPTEPEKKEEDPEQE